MGKIPFHTKRCIATESFAFQGCNLPSLRGLKHLSGMLSMCNYNKFSTKTAVVLPLLGAGGSTARGCPSHQIAHRLPQIRRHSVSQNAQTSPCTGWPPRQSPRWPAAGRHWSRCQAHWFLVSVPETIVLVELVVMNGPSKHKRLETIVQPGLFRKT